MNKLLRRHDHTLFVKRLQKRRSIRQSKRSEKEGGWLKLLVTGAELRRNSTNNREKRTMKKILVLATIFGCAVAITAKAADAKENYDKMCAKCHGPDGKGQTKMGQKLGIKDLTDAKVQASFTDDQAFKALKEGLKDADGKTLMKPVEGLSDDEIKALVAQVRTLK
jgi:cytochrome c553